jgi:endonuclease/exonuclease/phosphatase family metal-dependent hydrolase
MERTTAMNFVTTGRMNGDLQRAIKTFNTDIVQLTETRTDLRHVADVTELKAFLLAHGYRYCYWTWCISSKGHGYAGSALLCRVKPD